MRTFDVGDKISVDNGATVYIVEKIHLLTTQAKTMDGKLVYLRNDILLATSVQNWRKSYNVNYSLEIIVPFDTPREKIVHFKKHMEHYFSKNSSEWHGDPIFRVELTGSDPAKLKIGIYCDLKYTWAETAKWKPATTELVLHAQQVCNKLDINQVKK